MSKNKQENYYRDSQLVAKGLEEYSIKLVQAHLSFELLTKKIGVKDTESW